MSDIELFEVGESPEGLAWRYFYTERFGDGIIAEEGAKNAAKGRLVITMLEVEDPLNFRRVASYMENYVADDDQAKGFLSLYLDRM